MSKRENQEIIDICYSQAIEILKDNSSKFGILASAKSSKAKARNYLSIFGRDASICSMGMIISGDKKLEKSARISLDTLSRYQADNGQIPFWVKPEKKQADFYYTGCIDSTLWWLIALKFYDINTGSNLNKKYSKKINLAINYLQANEHPQYYLLKQNEASDWADLMPRSGFVLYTNALWYWVKKLYNIQTIDKTKLFFNYIFDSRSKIPNEYFRLKVIRSFVDKKYKSPSYLSFVNFSSAGYEEDVFGNILACLVGLTDSNKTKNIINHFIKNKVNKPWPIKSVVKPIRNLDNLWREYMNRHSLNKTGHYHNGGIWPFIGGFWIILLTLNNKKLAQEELYNLARLNSSNNFNEWFDAKGNKKGMGKQSWNAALYIWAYNNIKN